MLYKYGYHCDIPKTGEIMCSSTPLYGYKTLGDEDISFLRPTDKNAYVKYTLTNGEAANVTMPAACIYSETFDGELCLKNNEFEISSQKIMDYFGYDANRWTNTDRSNWENPSQTIKCKIDESEVRCEDVNIGVSARKTDYLYAIDNFSSFYCGVNSSGNIRCQ